MFDTGGFSTWGRLTAAGEPHGGSIALRASSGNLDRPQQNWSAWSKAVDGATGGAITAPPARFVQWEATLKAAAGRVADDRFGRRRVPAAERRARDRCRSKSRLRITGSLTRLPR